MDNKVLILLFAAGGYYMYDQNKKLQLQLDKWTRYNGPNAWDNPRYRNVAPSPSSKSEAWRQWVLAIVSIFGSVNSLFKPGGPFYGQKEEDIYDVVNEGTRV